MLISILIPCLTLLVLAAMVIGAYVHIAMKRMTVEKSDELEVFRDELKVIKNKVDGLAIARGFSR